MRRPVQLLAGLALAALMSCSSPWRGSDGDALENDSGRYASAAAVCALIGNNDLQAALGRSYEDGFDPGISNSFALIPGVTKCRYAPAGDGRGLVETGVIYAYAEQIFAEELQKRSGRQHQSVAGLGQRAMWYPEVSELLVLEAEQIFCVFLSPVDAGEPRSDLRERARRLAVTALGRW